MMEYIFMFFSYDDNINYPHRFSIFICSSKKKRAPYFGVWGLGGFYFFGDQRISFSAIAGEAAHCTSAIIS